MKKKKLSEREGGRGKKKPNERTKKLSLSLSLIFSLSLSFSKLTLCQRVRQVRQGLIGEESVAPGVEDLGEGRGRGAERESSGDDKEHGRDEDGKAQQLRRLGRHFFAISLSLFRAVFSLCACFKRKEEKVEGGVGKVCEKKKRNREEEEERQILSPTETRERRERVSRM